MTARSAEKKKNPTCVSHIPRAGCVWYITAAMVYMEEKPSGKSLLVRSQQLHSLLCHRQFLSSSYSSGEIGSPLYTL